MKVLFLCQRMVFDVNDKNRKFTTGYSYMVRDIARAVAKENVQVELLSITNEKKLKDDQGIPVYARTFWDILRNFRIRDIKRALQVIRTYKPIPRMALTVLYYYLSNGYVEKQLKAGSYDLIHVHGLGYGGLAYADCCEQMGKDYLLTLHSLASNQINITEGEKQLEWDFLHRAKDKRILVTTISTGMRRWIDEYLKQDGGDGTFHVVLNGTDICPDFENTADIRERYGIPKEQKILLCVGNLSKNKNQVQIVHALSLLPDSTREGICVLFCGQDNMNGALDREIERLDLSGCVRVCGSINKDKIGAYYAQADYTVLASISDGFGLAIIEGFAFGLPNLTFCDLEAFCDLYDEKAILGVNDRTDEALAAGIGTLLEKNWDAAYIRQYAKKFSLQNNANGYIKLYRTLIERIKNYENI